MELLNDMALFVEVVRAKGFRRAAQALDMPGSTLSRRISQLERAIGLRLLHRTTRKIELTEAGQIYFERCQRIVDEARLAHEQLGEMLTQPTGTVRISLPVDFAVTWLAQPLVEFAARYPAIDFSLDLTPRQISLISDPFDLAVRIGEPEDSQLIARPLITFTPQLYASPGYLARAGEPQSPAELEHHTCLNMPGTRRWTLHNGQQRVTTDVSGRFSLNNMGMIRRLAVLDAGLILVAEKLVAEDVACGRLRNVLPDWSGTPLPVYALTATRLLPARVQLLLAFLRERLAQ
ncbi:LysR family transcriptional regulator [Enterobacteriaceae bacterium 4M9]|nr:LysR family transcriptional regulator [Enterobacteriaceae bacterium 4M9]